MQITGKLRVMHCNMSLPSFMREKISQKKVVTERKLMIEFNRFGSSSKNVRLPNSCSNTSVTDSSGGVRNSYSLKFQATKSCTIREKPVRFNPERLCRNVQHEKQIQKNTIKTEIINLIFSLSIRIILSRYDLLIG